MSEVERLKREICKLALCHGTGHTPTCKIANGLDYHGNPQPSQDDEPPKELAIAASSGSETLKSLLSSLNDRELPVRSSADQLKDFDPAKDGDMQRLAAEVPDGFDGKAIPYLGWYWRDLESWEQEHGVQLSAPNPGVVAIDVAQKWEYPCCKMSPADTKFLAGLLAAMGRCKYQILALLLSYSDKMKALSDE